MKIPKTSRFLAAGFAAVALGGALFTGCSSHKPKGGSYAFEPYPSTGAATSTLTTHSWTDSSSATFDPETLQRVVNEAHELFATDASGKNADYIPYLASVPSNLFAVVIVTVDGQVYSAGDIDYSFSIQSCSKVFTLAQVLQESGEDAVLEKIGVEPTGLPFNSITAL